MNFLKITLTPAGLLYLKWLSSQGNIWESWFEPEDGIAFLKALMKTR